ncbi:hypothetical protein OXX79_006171 [Metschnikowia pulcherrima]
MLLIPVKSSIHTLAFMNISDLRFDSSSPAKPNGTRRADLPERKMRKVITTDYLSRSEKIFTFQKIAKDTSSSE